MSEGQFFQAHEDYWQPDYGEIDWRYKLDIQYERAKIKKPTPVWFQYEDLVFQLTPDNTYLYRCRVDPQFNAIAVLDPTEGEEDYPFVWVKATTPEFENMVKVIYPYWCTEIRTEIPVDHIALIGLKRIAGELPEPDQWS